MYLSLQVLITVLEFIAFCFVIYKYKFLYHSSLRLMLLVIPFIFISDAIQFVKLTFSHRMTQDGNNINYYNITNLVTSLLYFGLYIENIKVPIYRKIFIIASGICLAFFFINSIYIQKGDTVHTYTYTICSLCLCVGVIFYVKEIVESEKIVYISRDPLFWTSIGLFAFYIINIPFWGMYNYLLVNYFEFLSMLLNVTVGLNILMYCCIIIGLLCLRK